MVVCCLLLLFVATLSDFGLLFFLIEAFVKLRKMLSRKKLYHARFGNCLKDQYGPRTFFLEFPFFAKNIIIKSILNLWWHSKILKLFLGVVRGIFTKRLKRTRRLLYTIKYDFFQMTALHSKC